MCGLLLHEDFYLVLQAEAGLLGYAVKLGPHAVTHPALVLDDVTVSTAVDKRNDEGVGPSGGFWWPSGSHWPS